MFVRSGLRVPTFLVLLGTALAAAPAWAGICRVTTAGTPFNNGSSWAEPVSLSQAVAVPQICSELWVAKGVYKPGTAGQASSTFSIANGVQVYGGFAGGETAREQRDPALNLTVLSGDIDNNDTTQNGVVLDALDIAGTNSSHVVIMANTGSGTVLDGFTITAGAGSYGGGLWCLANGNGTQSTPVLSRLVFSGNSATLPDATVSGGGGLVDFAIDGGNASPSLIDVVFRGNRGTNGGALLNYVEITSTASPSLTRVQFVGNTALGSGGAYYHRVAGGASNTTMNQVMFIENGAAQKGGAISGDSTSNMSVNRAAFVGNTAGTDGGAVALVSGGTLSIGNATFSGNAAQDEGGALFNQSTALTLTNVTLSTNQASTNGGALLTKGGTTVLRDAILWGNLAPLGQTPEIFLQAGSITVDHSIVKGSGGSSAWNVPLVTDAGGNLDADPLLGALSDDLGDTMTRRPALGSPAIDSGSNCAADDQRGIARPQGPQCDMGAVETVTINLISHNGFEECWAPALTRAVFLARVRTAIDGTTTCIPSYSGNIQGVDVTSCTNPDCPGGATGCPITITASAFDDGGNFSAGQLTATGTANDLVVPVSTQFGNCQYTASNVTTSYDVDFVFTPDGNGGVYSALLNRFVPTATNLTLSSGNSNCQLLAANITEAFKNTASAAVAAALRPAIEAGTVGQTVCPLQ